MPQVQLLGRSRRPVRCAYCHDAAEAVEHCCPGCGTWTHLDCHHELGRCPTVGCNERTPRVDAEPGWGDVAAAFTHLLDQGPLARIQPDASSDAHLRLWAERAEAPAGAWASRAWHVATHGLQAAVHLAGWAALGFALLAPERYLRPGFYGVLWEGIRQNPPLCLLLGALPTLILGAALVGGARSSVRLVRDWLALRSLSRARPLPARLQRGPSMPSGRVQLQLLPVEGGPPIPPALRRVWVPRSALPGWTATPRPVLLYAADTAPGHLLLENTWGTLAFVRLAVD